VKGSDEEIYLSSESGGVTVEHFIMTLDSDSTSHINFLSSAGPAYCKGKISGKQILVSEEAYRILAPKFPKASFLPCQYFRPIVLGNIKVELLPSGESPGSSFLRIEKKNESLFYAFHWSRQSSSAMRKAVFKPSSTLLIRLQSDPFHIFSSHSRREIDRLIEFAQKMIRAGENLVVVVDAFGESQNLASRLHEALLPIGCDSKLYQIMKIIHDSIPPTQVPSWMKALKKNGADCGGMPRVVFVSKQHLIMQRPRTLAKGIWVWIGLDIEVQSRSPWLANITFADSFAIQNSPDIAEIYEMVNEVKPSHVLIFGEGAPNYVHQLARHGIPAEFFAPPKIETLF
jgi:hypothetical protein